MFSVVGLIVGLFVSAGILGLIVTTMEQEDFPGWGVMLGCALAAEVPMRLINYYLPPWLFVVGVTVGAVCGGCAVASTAGMTLKRAAIATGIFFGIQLTIAAVQYFAFPSSI